AAQEVVAKGFRALKLDPFGTAQGFIDAENLDLAYRIVAALRADLGPSFRILIDVHARFTEHAAVRAAERLAPLDIFWWEEPATREREEPANAVAKTCPIAVATGEMYDTVGQFYTLARGGGVNIFQPEPMSLGGISNTMAVAHLAQAHGSWIAPHQSGGPVATAVCLQLAACVPNFLIQEHFDPFNEPWTRELVSWTPSIDAKTGHLSLPDSPGLGLELNLEIAREHPYDPDAYLNIHREGWERRLGQKARR
ncbi:MAG: mandelate racemase/muconate lactonizing enzyme family protein, partial [Verrucomicrobiae bacterium]|nr:mandelate racemase/muconate lactonizing enzyme family protein [Verrucomicrobiae bacterium]